MKKHVLLGLCVLVVVCVALRVEAQETSRVLPFPNLATTLPPATPGQAVTVQLQDAAGTVLVSEAQTVDVDDEGRISFVFGSLTLGGLDPTHFPSGSSRFLDVVDATSTSVLALGRLALQAVAFALSPASDVPVNLTMVDSTATAGNLLKGGVRFLHNFGVANTFLGSNAGNLMMSGINNTASGAHALQSNTTGFNNTASGAFALRSNTTGSNNTAIGVGATVSVGNLTNATAIGAGAVVNASNTIRLGNALVTVIEGQVGFTSSSDATQKENFQPVDGEEVLRKIGGLGLTSWNFIGQDATQFRHYGPVAQEFFAAFGHDGLGTIGTPTTITSTDMAGILMIAVQTLEKRTARLTAENAALQARLDALERVVLVKEARAQQ